MAAWAATLPQNYQKTRDKDVAADPNERKNLIKDPQYASDVKQLTQKLLTHMQRTDDPQLKAFETAVAN